ncbi:hypothetical protein MM236_17610 [Belliella sp. DSM 107340]|uniref:GyrI-like small molecule binding domain-containing protein n=1 Tax=Belliella calami TaxID=2923436 RepID=A0ABS9UT73_9BACT|nr:hypothetical protein [Belliella calami]MCH7399815.1 hypothetical protein [Belliella calami]
MKKWIIGVVILLLVSAGFLLFSHLGGFNEVEMELIHPLDLEIHGVYYRGTPQDEQLSQAFEKVSRVAKASGIPLYTIYYIEPAGKLDTMEVFVGVESEAVYPEFESRKFEANGAVLAKISGHRFVMPGPNKVKKKIVDFAKQSGKNSPTVFIDKIISSDEVQVIAVIED